MLCGCLGVAMQLLKRFCMFFFRHLEPWWLVAWWILLGGCVGVAMQRPAAKEF